MGEDRLHPGRLAVAAVRALGIYEPGKPISELERELGISNIIKLASNENPWGPSPGTVSAMQAAIADVWLYPDGSGHELKQALAASLGVDARALTLGNGSNDLLVLLAECFLQPGLNAVCSQYGFAIYPLVIAATGARVIEAPALPAGHEMTYGHDLAAMAAAVDAETRLVFIANPNNPTGTWVQPDALLDFIRSLPEHVLVVLDEAYLEYGCAQGCQDGLAWLRDCPNLVVLRTFSKAYGLAGARVGYAVSHPEVAERLNRLRPPFNVNSIALCGATAALRDTRHMQGCVTVTVHELARVRRQLLALGLRVGPSAANFLLVHVGPQAAQVYQQLLRGGVIVRPLGGYGLREHLRITIGKPEENDRLLRLLAATREERA
jgi:histidinol-phosphate aminotransferase